MVKHFGLGCRVRYFCQDESRFGLKTLLGRRITLRGVQPLTPVQWPRENFWLYGAVEPSSGEHLFYSFSHLDAVCFQRFIELLSARFRDSLNLLHLDQASAHVSTTLSWPDNVVPIFQPAHSPQLNPMERVWQDLKQQLKNQNFQSLRTLQQRVFELVNSLAQKTLRSLTAWSYLLAVEPSLQLVHSF